LCFEQKFNDDDDDDDDDDEADVISAINKRKPNLSSGVWTRPLQWSYSVRVHIVCVQGLALKWLFEPVDAFRSHLPHSRGP